MKASTSRRAILAMSSVAVAATVIGVDVGADAADEVGPDADLLALRPLWLQKLADLDAVLDAKSVMEGTFYERRPDYPDHEDYTGRPVEYAVELRRVHDVEAKIKDEIGLTENERLEDLALAADDAVVCQIAATPAKTMKGILFKREVLLNWEACVREDLSESLLTDLLAMLVGGEAASA